MNRQTRSLIIPLWTHIKFQADLTRGNKHGAHAVIVSEQREFAKFIDGTVPFEGRQLVIVVVWGVGAVGGLGEGAVGRAWQTVTTGAEDHIAHVIELHVARE